MASSYFALNPSTGYGNSNVSVSALTTNLGSADLYGTITVSNGSTVKYVYLRQKYKPFFTQQGSTTIPSTGGSIQFTVSTEYDVVFRSVPSWITITDINGNSYAQGQRIAYTTASGTTFLLNALQNNTGAERSAGATFNMGHYIGDTLQNSVQYFTVTQPAYVPPTYAISVNPSTIILDYTPSYNSGTSTISTTNISSVTVTNNGTSNFNVVPTGTAGNGTVISATTRGENLTTADKTGTITVQGQGGGSTYSATIDVVQKFKPYLNQTVQSVPYSGGVITLYVYGEYDFFMRNIPSFCTVTVNGSNYSEGETINAGIGYSAFTVMITVAANPSAAQRAVTNSFYVGHYKGSQAITTGYINFTQDGDPSYEKDLVLSPTSFSPYANETSIRILVTEVNCTWLLYRPGTSGYYNTNPSFTINSFEPEDDAETGKKYIVVTFPANQTDNRKTTTLSITLKDSDDNTYTHSVSITHLARGEA